MLTREQFLEFARKEAYDLDLRMAEMHAEYASLQNRRSALAVILGDDGTVPTVAQSETEANHPIKEVADDDNVSEAARLFVCGTGDKGFKPKDVTAKVVSMGMKVSAGFSSNLLFRMKKKGEVVEYKSRYYLPQFDPRPKWGFPVIQDQTANPAAAG